MRTTVEMRPEHRSALIALAARRGNKGFSAVLEEAIDFYLAGEKDREKKRAIFHSLAGSLTDQEGEELMAGITKIRSHWR